MINFILGFILGSVITFVGIFVYSVHRAKIFRKRMQEVSEKVAKKLEDAANELEKQKDDLQKFGSLKYRLKQIADITDQQYQLLSAGSLPSSNSLHSKQKNLLGPQFKDLEARKKVLFQSILDDGHDPDIKIVGDGEEKMMKLSEFMKSTYSSPEPAPSATPTKTDTKSTSGKLRLVQPDETIH